MSAPLRSQMQRLRPDLHRRVRQLQIQISLQARCFSFPEEFFHKLQKEWWDFKDSFPQSIQRCWDSSLVTCHLCETLQCSCFTGRLLEVDGILVGPFQARMDTVDAVVEQTWGQGCISLETPFLCGHLVIFNTEHSTFCYPPLTLAHTYSTVCHWTYGVDTDFVIAQPGWRESGIATCCSSNSRAPEITKVSNDDKKLHNLVRLGS